MTWKLLLYRKDYTFYNNADATIHLLHVHPWMTTLVNVPKLSTYLPTSIMQIVGFSARMPNTDIYSLFWHIRQYVISSYESTYQSWQMSKLIFPLSVFITDQFTCRYANYQMRPFHRRLGKASCLFVSFKMFQFWFLGEREFQISKFKRAGKNQLPKHDTWSKIPARKHRHFLMCLSGEHGFFKGPRFFL